MALRKITYIKLLEKVTLQDGTIIDKGTSVRFNYKEGPFFNVELHDTHNVKRIFWITEEKGKVSTTRSENWTPKMAIEHQKDIAESWFDQENTKTAKDTEKKKKTPSKKTAKKSK